MSAEDDLRLAWRAHRDGRIARRDALLTLAVAGGEAEGAKWVPAVRDLLVAAHPGHLFAGFYHLDEALGDRRVQAALARLRLVFPSVRVRHLLAREAALSGPFTGRAPSLGALLQDLLAGPTRPRPRFGSRKLGDASTARPAPTSMPTPEPTPPSSLLAFYLNVLLGVAALCAIVLEESGDKRAA